jgi:cytochrome c-type biogenesis protein CcmH/NrfF
MQKPLTRHIHTVSIPKAASNRLNGSNTLLREKVLEMHQRGMSDQQIADAIGLRWTRVGRVRACHRQR